MTYQFKSDISALSLSDGSDFACVALWDAPLYSLVMLHAPTMTLVARRSAACYLDEEKIIEFLNDKEIKRGSAETHNEAMELDNDSQSTTFSSLNCYYPVNGVNSI